MKTKLSISIDKESINLIEKKIKKGIFRNKSHAIEFSLKKTLKGVKK